MRSATNIIIVELIIAVLQSDFAFAFEHIDIYIYQMHEHEHISTKIRECHVNWQRNKHFRGIF